MVTKNDDYGYIAEFIDYLERLINIIVNLFKGLGGNNDTTTTTAAPTT